MIIYLEGPDGSGKSTLSDVITEELMNRDLLFIQTKDGYCNVDTHPRSKYRNTPQQLIDAFVDMAYKEAIFVLDRGPISDVIYRHFDDYKPVLNEHQVVDLLSLLKDKVKVIFCNNDIAEQKMLERGDDNPIAIEKHKDITNCYRQYMKSIRHEMFDYTKTTAPIFADKIVDSLSEEDSICIVSIINK